METQNVKIENKVVKMSELDSLKNISAPTHPHRKEIPVRRSNDERCIYKVLELNDDFGIYIQIYQQYVHANTFFGGGKWENCVELCLHTINPPHEFWKKYFDEEPIELIVDDLKIKTRGIESGPYGKAIELKEETGKTHIIGLEHYMNNVGTIVESGADFKSKFAGVLFPIKIHDRTWERIKTPYSMFTAAIGRLGIARGMFFPEGNEQMVRLVVNLMTKKGISISSYDTKRVEGVSKTMMVIKPFFDKALEEKKYIFGLIAFIELIESTKRTINSTKFSVVFNKMFSTVQTQEDFDAKLKELSSLLVDSQNDKINTHNKDLPDYVMDSLPEAREIKKAAIKRKSTGAINKIMDDLDFISIDKDKYPLTHEAIFSGDIPKGTFFRKNGESYFVYNDNWEIWERMLKEHRATAIEIASEASRRTTFEKDIMSYFFFVLEKLPNYLERHTGKQWKCFPKLISAERELDPPTEGDNGVSKSRSALTPIVDNEKNEVVVPYVSMRLSGYQTTYCYGLDYNVLERGLSFKGNTVTQEVEMLNGRDNYGLMFYTLTGSAQAQGYPTFLIIFEDLSDGSNKKTHVHFHRTHPMRSKGGDYNPVHGWILGCFKWMVGNVNFERVRAQQGDLVFVQMTSPIEEGELNFQEVNAFDSHKFESPVKFIPYMKKEKSNILGYFRIEKDMMLNHVHHKARFIPAGDYELRQCRSWEANPKGVWSLRID